MGFNGRGAVRTPSFGIENDRDIRAALEWFEQITEDHSDLVKLRVRTVVIAMSDRYPANRTAPLEWKEALCLLRLNH